MKCSLAIILLALAPAARAQETGALVVRTAPGAVVWVDSLRYGAVPDSGELTVRNLRAGAHTVRARLKGRREVAQPVTVEAGSERGVEVSLAAAASPAEARFQAAEELRERGKHAEAIKEYQQAIRLGVGKQAARLGLARSLLASGKHEAAATQALSVIRERGGNSPEGFTVLGNIRRAEGFTDDALENYRRALAQGRNFSPEAHTGLALTYQDLGRPRDAIKEYRLAAAQSNGTEPVIYFLFGTVLEREGMIEEAVKAYEKFLELSPKATNAAAVRSIVKQLKREMQ
jgi:tetratricopeptide (TPR) repeat protein